MSALRLAHSQKRQSPGRLLNDRKLTATVGTLRSYTGEYDLFGIPVFTTGNVLVDPIYRFKDQSAPCVIFSEIDFETFDELVSRKLFVSITRATMKLFLVISEHSSQMLFQQPTGEG